MSLIDRVLGREPRSRVNMLASVGDHVAGEAYDVPVSTADRWIARGYATGEMSRRYSDEELRALRSNIQIVSV